MARKALDLGPLDWRPPVLPPLKHGKHRNKRTPFKSGLNNTTIGRLCSITITSTQQRAMGSRLTVQPSPTLFSLGETSRCPSSVQHAALPSRVSGRIDTTS